MTSSSSLSLLPLSSSLPSPHRRHRRKNHLRPKIRIPTKPQSQQTLILTHHQLLLQEIQENPYQQAKQQQLIEAESEPLLDPLPVPTDLWLPGHALRFVALLAVQTAVAVWFLGRNDASEEEMGDGVRVRVSEEEVVKGREFEKTVSEIREMAREREVVEAEGVKENAGRGIGKLRRDFAKGILGEEGSRRKGVRFVREAMEAEDETDISEVDVRRGINKLRKNLEKGNSEEEEEKHFSPRSSSRKKKSGICKVGI